VADDAYRPDREIGIAGVVIIATNACSVVLVPPMRSDPIKYEIDKATGAIYVDRFMSTAMRYPCSYGYIPQTLAPDGDPADVLVIAPFQLQPGVVVICRAEGLLRMEDEHGQDDKILAVPISRLTRLYDNINEPSDLSEVLRGQIAHFFAHYKDLEPGKYVRVGEYESATMARKEMAGTVVHRST
jgi:inorganic pyrophosphatase